MSKILIRIVIFGFVFLALGSNKLYIAKEKKPNIIFILTDDQRWDALGYAGNTLIHSPNMDQLASEGLYFKNAFVLIH